MSNVNIKRAIDSIKANTTIYTPIVETIVNAIQAIECKNEINGEVNVIVKRSIQPELENKLASVDSFVITDNGIGFNDDNRESFDTFYSDYKIELGGKGFGRFMCLKYFDNVYVDSTYYDSHYKRRTFNMGRDKEIIVRETITDISDTENTVSGTTITLDSVKKNFPDKGLPTMARSLVEILLPYFITKDYVCPVIILSEEDGTNRIILNNYIIDSNAIIREVYVTNNTFSLGQDEKLNDFEIRVFKIYSPKNKVSKISLVAHMREVTESSIHDYIPEFCDEFYDKKVEGGDNQEKNYIIKTYVFSKYLDDHVSLERGGFEFKREYDLLYGISQLDIESKAAELTKEAVIDDISVRQDKKKQRIMSYVDEEAPWHKTIVNNIDLSKFPYRPSNEDIETRLQIIKYHLEMAIKNEVNAILNDNNVDLVKESVSEIVSKISESGKNDLIHYIAMRRKVLDLFKKSLEFNDVGRYSSEGVVHDIIFPLKKDSDTISFDEHNLWIIDERLNFTNYVSSDLPLNGGLTERPDLLAYDNRVAFRGDNESSNPVTIFEFKKPNRDDFVNPSSKEDPVQQIVRYVNSIKEGKFKTPEGRKMNIAENTPFFGYVICDLNPKVENWLLKEKEFKPMPDSMGWFQWRENINLYIEVMSWDKLLKNAVMRNKIFFHKLGIL